MPSTCELSFFLLFMSNYFNPKCKLLTQIFALTGTASPLSPLLVASSPTLAHPMLALLTLVTPPRKLLQKKKKFCFKHQNKPY